MTFKKGILKKQAEIKGLRKNKEKNGFCTCYKRKDELLPIIANKIALIFTCSYEKNKISRKVFTSKNSKSNKRTSIPLPRPK